MPWPSEPTRRIILLNDHGLGDEELASIWIHELAHDFLLPAPPSVPVEFTSVFFSDAGQRHFAETRGLGVEAFLEAGIIQERQACQLAAIWGATGASIDVDFCTSDLRRELFQVRAAAARASFQAVACVAKD